MPDTIQNPTASNIDLSAGMIPKQPPKQDAGIDLSAGLVPREESAQPVSLHQLTAALPGAMQSRPGGPITNVQNPQASEQDPGVWQGLKDSVWDTAHGLYSLAKAQWEHSAVQPFQELSEGHYKQGAVDALKAIILPDPKSPVHQAARNVVLDSLSNEYATLKNRAATIARVVTGDLAGAKKSAAQSVKSQIKAIPAVGEAIVKTGEDFNDQPRYAIGEGLGLGAQMAVPEAIGESGIVGGLGKLAEKIAPESMNTLLRANKQVNYLYGKNPGSAFIDEGIKIPKDSVTMGGQLENLHGQLEAAGDSLSGQINQALSEPSVAAKQLDIVPAVKNTIANAKKFVSQQTGLDVPKYVQQLNELEDSILTRYDSEGNPIGKVTGTTISPAEVADIKKSLGKNTQWNVLPTDPEVKLKTSMNGVRKQIYGQLADMVENAAPNSNIKKLNSRFSNIIEAQGLLERRIALEHGTGGYNAALRKGEFWTGLAGVLFGPEPISKTLGAGLMADRVIRSVPGKMVTAKTLAGAGEALQSPVVQGAVSKVGAVGQAAKGTWTRVHFADDSEHLVHPQDVDEALRRNPSAKVVDEDEDTSGWQKIRLTDGRQFLIHPEDLVEAKKRDAGLRVIEE